MGTVANILAGHFDAYYKLYVAPGTGVNMDPVTGNVVGLTATWVQFGFQNPDGAQLSDTPEYLDAEVADTNGLVKSNLVKERPVLKFSLLESDLNHIDLSSAPTQYTVAALAGTNPNLLTSGDKTNANIAADYYTICLSGTGSTGNAEIWVFYKCLAKGPLEITYNKYNWRVVPFNFEVYSVTARAAGDRHWRAYEITSA